MLPYTFKDNDPKLMLRELLGDFFIDPNALEKKELLGEGKTDSCGLCLGMCDVIRRLCGCASVLVL